MHQTAIFFKQQIEKYDGSSPGRVRVFFVSQWLPDLAKGDFMPKDDACIKLKATDNADDIRMYVRKKRLRFSEEGATSSGFNLSDVDLDQIESMIRRRSEGLFHRAWFSCSGLTRRQICIYTLT